VQGYSLNLSGGDEAIRYFVSGDVNSDEGAEVTNFQDQYSGRANVQITPHEKFDVSVNTGYTQNETSLTCEAGCGGTMWTATFSTPANLAENRCQTSPGFGCDFWGGFRSGPPEYTNELDFLQNVDRFTGSVQLNYRPFGWLSNRLTFGTDVTQENNVELLPFQTTEVNRYFWGETTGDGYRYETRRDQTFNTFDYVGTASFDLSPALNSSTSAGIQYYTRHIEFLGAQGDGFAGPGLTTIDAAALKPYAGSDYLDNNTLGVYVQEVIGLNDRLFLTGAVRVDNNSAFGSELDFVTYPKASLSWVLSEEPAFQNRMPSLVNTFKLRLAYGESGQQPVSLSALRTFEPITGPNGTSAVTPLSLGNAELGPERGQEIEAGFDAALFDDRVGLEFTFYRTLTKDGILLRPIAPSTGYPGSRWVNAGEILNQGVEALLRANLLSSRRFAWDANLSLATNKGEVQKLAGGDTTIVTGSTQYKIGYAPNSWFRERVVSANYDPATDQVSNVQCDDGNGGTTPCYNSAGQVVAPRVYLGRTTPALEGSVGSNVRLFERFIINGLLDFKTGYKKLNNNDRARCQVFRTCLENVYPEQYDAKLIAQLRSGGPLRDFSIQDASFARLREVSLTYDVPATFARNIGARGANITLAARNLYTWTNYGGLDPENSFLTGSFLEQSNLPQLTQFIATFNVSF
jgi:outer membrane receptor protein involved in Fe transport